MKYLSEFSKLNRLSAICVCILILDTLQGFLMPVYGQWEKHIIDNTLSIPDIVSVGDINSDSKPDVVVSDYGVSKIFWYENPTWAKYTIDNWLGGAYHVRIADINGDGAMDIVASGYTEGVVIWYENNHPTWTPHIIDSDRAHSGCIKIADIDGDDTLDVVSGIRDNDVPNRDFVWYENNHSTWTKHIICTDCSLDDFVFGDIDGDDIVDAVVSRWTSRKVVWFRNENGGLSWTEHIIDENTDTNCLSLVDINGDGNTDVINVGYDDNNVKLYENYHPVWNKLFIDQSLLRANGLGVIDIDGDERLDVVASGENADLVVWYKNNYPLWEKNIIDADIDGPKRLVCVDIDGDSAFDVVIIGRIEGSLVWYRNPGNIAYGKSMELYPTYLNPNGETLHVNAQLRNPDNHHVKVFAVIYANGQAVQDSIQLFDDGLHGDGDADDNLYGGSIWFSGLDENIYTMDLSINDITVGALYYPPFQAHFTTIGPVEFDSLRFSEDSQVMPGGRARIYITLKNNSVTTKVTDIDAQIVGLEPTLVEIFRDFQSYRGEMAPGQTVESRSYYILDISNDCPGDTDLPIKVNISSNDQFFWCDTFDIHIGPTAVQSRVEKVPKKFALHQNYPNPFNPLTVIRYALPVTCHLDLSIYNILGQKVATLVSERQQAGHYQVQWDATDFSSGIYYYQLVAGDHKEVKPMILLK